jgi:hypothetical protein
VSALLLDLCGYRELTCVFSGGERAFVFPPAEEGFGGGVAAERVWERDRVVPGGGGGAAILFPIAAAVLMGILQNNER